MKFNVLSLLFLLGVNCLPASAQHHYEYGGSRVVRQSQNGLATPSSTYIGAGTLSKTAQGIEPNSNPSLPSVNYGGAIKTPGDNIYRPKEPQQRSQRRYYQQPRYMYMPQQQRQNYYTPGQNQQTYNEYKPDRSNFGYSQPGSGGLSTYGGYGQQQQSSGSGRHF